MAAEARHRKANQENLPMIHFYEEFTKRSTGTSRFNGTSSRLQRRQTSISSDKTMMYLSPEILTTRSTVATRTESIHGVSVPISPLASTTEELSSCRQKAKEIPPPSSAATSKKGRTQDKPWKPTQTKAKTTEPAKRLTLYERSQIRLKEREKKVQRIRDEMMRECTFRPNANNNNKGNVKGFKSTKRSGSVPATTRTSQQRSPTIVSNPTGSTEATTPTTTTSSTRQYWQDFQRKQEKKQRRQQHVSTTSTASKDGSRTVSTTKSLRFEELYQDGLRRARQRPATEKAEQELRQRRQEEKDLQECTFKPKLYWGHRLMKGKRRTPKASRGENKASSNVVTSTRSARRSLSPRRQAFEPFSARRKMFEPALRPIMKPRSLLVTEAKDPIPNIDFSPIDRVEDESCGSLSLLRRHHDIMRERNKQVDSPIPPLPLEIITTGIRPMSPVEQRPWRTALYTRDDSISPLRGRALGIESDVDDEKSTHAPRVIYCGTTVGGESEAAQTQATEYGSI